MEMLWFVGKEEQGKRKEKGLTEQTRDSHACSGATTRIPASKWLPVDPMDWNMTEQ